jgi:hypothetical protein
MSDEATKKSHHEATKTRSTHEEDMCDVASGQGIAEGMRPSTNAATTIGRTVRIQCIIGLPIRMFHIRPIAPAGGRSRKNS